MHNKKVSIIIPCFNQSEYVTESIDSALSQTYNNIEIVVVNDGSTDNSSDVIKEYSKKHKNIIFFDEKENKGVVHARNLAIEKANGEYILPLDADDTIEPTYIEKAIKILDKNPNIGIVYCKARLFGSKDEEWKLPEFNKETIIFANQIFCTALFRKNDFNKVGKYKDYMKNGCEDWDLWLSFIELGLDAYRIDEILFNYRQYENGNNRSVHCDNNIESIFSNIGLNHHQLYFTNKKCIDYLFLGWNLVKHSKEKVKYLEKKLNKYKKLFNIFLPIVIIGSILIFSLVILVYAKGF